MSPTPAAQRLRRLVRERREDILACARRHGARSIRLFGSVARGDAREESDLDFLVTWAPEAGVFARLDLQEELEAMLGVRVDIAVEGGLHRVIRDDVLREAIPV